MGFGRSVRYSGHNHSRVIKYRYAYLLGQTKDGEMLTGLKMPSARFIRNAQGTSRPR